MPKNTLAPKPLNQLEKLLAETAKYPQYGEMVDYLTQREMMPPIEQRRLGPATAGQFSTNGFFGDQVLPKTGLIEVNFGAGPSDVLHELTHAADGQLNRDYINLNEKRKKSDLTPEEKRFMSAYTKLAYDPNAYHGNPAKYPRVQLANKLSPEWVKKETNYRSRGNEMAAFGVGSIAERDFGYKPPLHLDPTMATEFLILMDLARRTKK
jgi:hypothetical protein